MNIQQISYTIKYSLINDLHQKVYASFSKLEKHFFLNNQISIPDNAPYEIPRFILKSINGHSEIAISPNAIAFNVVKIDNGYNKNWDLCRKYLSDKLDVIYGFVSAIGDNDFSLEYMGLVASVNYEDEFPNDNITEMLKKNLLKNNSSMNLYDLNVRYTFAHDEDIFINVSLQNTRLFGLGINGNKAGELSLKNQKKEVLGAMIDINDRLAFNSKIGYCSKFEVAEKLLNCMTQNINEKVLKLVRDGEYSNE